MQYGVIVAYRAVSSIHPCAKAWVSVHVVIEMSGAVGRLCQEVGLKLAQTLTDCGHRCLQLHLEHELAEIYEAGTTVPDWK